MLPRRFIFLPVAAALALAPGLPAAEATAGAPGKYVLFMGSDLSVQQGKKFYPVEDVDGSEFVITVGGKPRFVRTRLQANHLKVQRELKLAPVSVQLDDLQGGPGYTPAADPRHKFNARSGAASGAAAAEGLADYNVKEITTTLEQVKNGAVQWKEREAQLETELSRQQGQLDVASHNLSSDYSSTPKMADALALELAEGNYDLVDVSFKISSPEPLDDPYMVVLVEFTPRGAKPGEISTLIHAKSLDPIGTEPKYVRIREGGLPVGFKYLRHEVHIFNRGREVATSESSKRVELSPDEARQYLLIEHLAANKGATLPPQPVSGSLSASVRRLLDADRLNRVCFARVAKDGQVIGIFADEGASLPLADETLTGAFARALFKPALANGRPMDGTVRVRLADLTL
ncbi:hypothetical protein ESB00_18690 [Oleiharenicola lentus]|uniref:Uncharacterized protein n=1 Tax=Oleiharenicola lentus TaxID=2508720 RepID=A0A4Q1C5T3_9BACT|nr:hypothetical protein [Oleiharenicola lentus]RXK53715.1 hypothetical protein ESB00_18690 [Oleiharenicola lentus]